MYGEQDNHKLFDYFAKSTFNSFDTKIHERGQETAANLAVEGDVVLYLPKACS